MDRGMSGRSGKKVREVREVRDIDRPAISEQVAAIELPVTK